jgi:uncharacterized protein YbjT (DUF2867 family)
MTATIAVTGATGIVGGGVAQRLGALGLAQRLVVRSPGRAPSIPGAVVAAASYADSAAAVAALAGIDTVFMVSGAEEPNRLAGHLTFVDAAVAAGVGRIVYTSFVNAGPAATFLLARDHWFTEQHIRESGLAFTFLRDNLYAEQFLEFAGPEGVLRGPAGDGRAAPVARADVIDVAVTVLADAAGRPGSSLSTVHDGATYDLTGPESLTMNDVAGILTRGTGHPVRYEPETVEQAYASRAVFGAPPWQLDAWVSTYTAIAAGELAEVTDDVRRVTGHRAMSLAELLGG